MKTKTESAIGVEQRTKRWDDFLDAYSTYLRDPSLAHAAELHLAAVALETADGSFSVRGFEARLGWTREAA